MIMEPADDGDGRIQETFGSGTGTTALAPLFGAIPKHDASHISWSIITGGRPILYSATIPAFGSSSFGARDSNVISPMAKEKAVPFSCQGSLCYTPTIDADTNDRIMSISAMPGASHLSVEELRCQYCQAHKIEPPKPFPPGGSLFGQSNGSASKDITNPGKQGKSQAQVITIKPAPSCFGGPGSDSSTPDALPTPLLGFPGTKPGNNSLFDKGPPTPPFGFPGTNLGNHSLFAPPTPSFSFPGTKPVNSGLIDTPGWFFSPKGCNTNPATPMDHLPGFLPAQTSQPTPPSPFTFKPATERDAGKSLFSTGIETHAGNSRRCKECGRHAPEEKHGLFDNHVPVATTGQAPSQWQQGDYRVCSKPTGADAERVGDGSRMAPSGLVPAIPVMMLPVVLTNGAFGAVPGNTGAGYLPGSYMFPGTTIPPFMVPHNLLATQTASRENATPFVYMQPVPLAAVNGLAQMFGRMPGV